MTEQSEPRQGGGDQFFVGGFCCGQESIPSAARSPRPIPIRLPHIRIRAARHDVLLHGPSPIPPCPWTNLVRRNVTE